MTAAARALSGDTELLGRLRRSTSTASVHSVFDRVVNLRPTAGGELWTLAVADVDDAPATLVLDLRRAGELGLEVGDLVTCADGQLRGPGGQLVDLGSTREWSAELPTLPFPASSAAWLRRHLVAEGVRGGALSRPTGPGAAPTMESAVADRLTVHLDGLLDALRAAAPEAVRHHASSLVGLGTGLTPAGDDALLGVILVAVMPGSMLAAARAPLAAVVRDAAARTTDVSHAALAQAVRGRTRESLMTLLHQLAEAADEQTLARLGRRVTAIGHTSGTDILTGLSAALDLDHQLRGEK